MYIDSLLELYVYLWLITSLSVTIYGLHIIIHLSIVLSPIIYFPHNNLCSICLPSIYLSIYLSVIHLSIHTSTYYQPSINISIVYYYLLFYIGYSIAVIKHLNQKQCKKKLVISHKSFHL